MIKLDKRLSSILDEIKGSVLADIGCDHGKISICALLSGKCERVIASDISEKSLNKAVELAQEYALLDKIQFRVSNGFENISESVDTAVIAGLGGYEIRDILFSKIPKVDRFVLCPHQNVSVARVALNQIGYQAIKDFVVKEGKKFYQIIVAEKGSETYSKSELRFGLNYPKGNDYYEMLHARKEVLLQRFPNGNIPEGEMSEEYLEIEKCLN